MAEGYEAEPTDVDAVVNALVGERDMDDDMQWWVHLSSRLALLAETERRIHDERARLAEKWSRVDGDSYAVICERVGLHRSRAQQLVERGRELRKAEGANDQGDAESEPR